jgi:aryl-alcohol dehydrogenase-like predicted oxidoreductase
MGKKQISREEFVKKTLAGIAGISMIPDRLIKEGPKIMQTRNIGKTTLMVTPLCFGATRTNELSLIQYAVDKGLTFIDTGRVYANGNNERLVGKAIAGIRKKLIIQSKIRLEENELPSKGKGKKGAEEIRDVLSSKFEASLKALDTDYIDIMLYHDALNEDLLFHSEVLKFFSDMKKSGALKASGFSTHNDHMHLPERNNSERVYDTIMVPFNHKGSFVYSVTLVKKG